MTVITTYVCDKCAYSEPKPSGYFEVSIGVKQSIGGYAAPQTKRTSLWCRSCVVKAGLTTPTMKERAPDPEPTIEDLVREIVQSEIGNQ